MWSALILICFFMSPNIVRGYELAGQTGCNSTSDCNNNKTHWSKHRESRSNSLEANAHCILPPYPEQGTYRVANVDDTNPGQTFNSVVLTVSCRRGFGLVASDNDGTEIGKHVYCINGRWLQNMPKCVRFCKLNPDPSVRYMCHVPGTGYKTCGTYVPPGTIVSPACNNLYYTNDDLPYMTCFGGFWDNVARCKADCGLITPEGEQLVIGGERAEQGELPWHVGIYSKTYEPYKQICGGSLVTNNVVLSAAHCFWSDIAKLLPAEDFAVAIGKLYRDWGSNKDIASQESDVKEIKIPTLFKGSTTNFQDDIAVVILTSPFMYKPFVRPICVNFETHFDTYQLQQGKYGKVAGWGLTDADGGSSPVLKVVSLPYIKTDTCIDTLPPSFTEYITSDKFCAGYTNGTALCKGDSGGGLAFAEKEQGRHRYYLRGIVSTAPRHDTKMCNAASLTTFTKIKKHDEFIKRSLAASVSKTCPWHRFQCADGTCVDQGADCNGVHDCADGSDEAVDLCTPEPDTLDELSDRACVFPDAPDGGRYHVINTFDEPSPGQILKSFTVVVNCHQYTSLLTPEDRIKSGSFKVVCVDGKWSDKMPRCINFCDVDYDRSFHYKCVHPITSAPMICNRYTKPGLACSPTERDHPIPDPVIKCASNSSKDVVPCKQDCGLAITVTKKGEGGKIVKREYMPWHVSIYEKNVDDYSYVCGGTLVSNNVVISAADRFWDEEKGYIKLSEWGAAAGQDFRVWDHEKNTNAQKSDVKGITVPDTYTERPGYTGDVAVIVLMQPFILTTYVKHVCLDWNVKLDKRQLRVDNVGKIAGWDRPAEDASLRHEVIQLPNIMFEMCNEYLPWFQEEQICTSYTNDTLPFLNGNVGSGLVFAHNSSGVERYYLRGVLTTKCIRDELCYIERDYTYATFTRISSFEKFIKHNSAL